MIAGAASILLSDNDNLRETKVLREVARASFVDIDAAPDAHGRQPFLRIPPFPKAASRRFTPLPAGREPTADLIAALRSHRVGGTYWAAQPELPAKHLLVRTSDGLGAAQGLGAGEPITLWLAEGASKAAVTGDCDPWHMLRGATALVTGAEDELRLVAALLGVPRYLFVDDGIVPDHSDCDVLLAEWGPAATYENPFTGEPMSTVEMVELCGFWRSLIDSNRDLAGGFGFAFWKQDHVGTLLWNGSTPFRFLSRATEIEAEKAVAVWRAKTPAQTLSALQSSGAEMIEVEDGFLRSRGLGADCIPPLSITIDRLGAHFDPTGPSELELLLEQGEFSADVLARAQELRRAIVDAGLGKYAQGGAAIERPAGQRRHVLVPGQVEDDRAVQTGGCGLTSNVELLERVRAEMPDAYILYKPHPDVVAGHRRGAISDRACRRYADQVVGDVSISSLINMVDEVHVNTSLAGFEALLRGKTVATYGVPFFAGWGLTRDLGPVPSRRTAKRTLDELVAATLLIYPRYLDPLTGLPCPAEVVVARLSQAEARDPGLLVGVRRLQGRLMRRLRSLVQ